MRSFLTRASAVAGMRYVIASRVGAFAAGVVLGATRTALVEHLSEDGTPRGRRRRASWRTSSERNEALRAKIAKNGLSGRVARVAVAPARAAAAPFPPCQCDSVYVPYHRCVPASGVTQQQSGARRRDETLTVGFRRCGNVSFCG